jgi:HlyD family secretion protein
MPDILSYLRSFRHLIHLPDGDGELLQRFRVKRDELAFATLVQRHGPMVLGIAQRILGQSDLLDDVFQATFLVLAKRGRQMETWPSVAGWLVQVARRTALQARAKSARRTRHEQQAAAMTPNSNAAEPAEVVSQRDLSQLLDAELATLPSKYRTPLVLCHLEGQTKEETARQLGWPVGSVGVASFPHWRPASSPCPPPTLICPAC